MKINMGLRTLHMISGQIIASGNEKNKKERHLEKQPEVATLMNHYADSCEGVLNIALCRSWETEKLKCLLNSRKERLNSTVKST